MGEPTETMLSPAVAVDWEALARQLGEALAELAAEHDEEIEGAACAVLDRAEDALAAYRAAEGTE